MLQNNVECKFNEINSTLVDAIMFVGRINEKSGVMRIAVMSFRLHAPWVHSLKEKRMIVKSILARLQNRFHVSAAEIDEQDTHQIIVIGVAAIIPNNSVADSMMDEISQFIEENCEAQILDEEREIR